LNTRDVSDQERELSLSEERLRLALQAANQAWFDLHVQTGEVAVSPEYGPLIGYTPEEFESSLQNWMDHIHPDDIEAVQKAFQLCLASKEPVSMEYRRQSKSGDWVWLKSVGKVIERDEGGRPLRVIGVHQMISDRKQVEEELRQSEKKYRSLFEHMINGFALHKIICDEQGKPIDYEFLEVNKSFEKMTGLKGEEIIGKLVTVVLPGTEDDPADWIGRYGQVALGGDPLKFEQYSEALDKHYSVHAFSPAKGLFATVVISCIFPTSVINSSVGEKILLIDLLSWYSGFCICKYVIFGQ